MFSVYHVFSEHYRKFIGGFSHKEIAHITGTTVAAAKKRYERAIKKLRAEMEVSP